MTASAKVLLLLFTLLLPGLLLDLGERPVSKIQEVRIAETAREMLESGDWIVPRYNGELRLQKPPLPYWLTALSYKAAGLSETSTRLPAVLFGLLTVVLMWSWLRRDLDLPSAAGGALVLATSFVDLRYFRSGEADAVLLFFISASCKLGFEILHGHHDQRRRLLFGLMLGLGFLSKGPAALAIPALTLLVSGAIERRARRLKPTFLQFVSLPGVSVLFLAAFGWYLWIIWQLPDIAQQFFGKQLDETFVSGTHAKPMWWYLAHWVEFFAPWGVLLIPAACMAINRGKNSIPPLIRFAWIWLVIVLVLLTFTVNKQTQYALLFAPPLAVILGHYLTHASGRFQQANRIFFGTFCLLALAGTVFALHRSNDIPLTLLWVLLPVLPLLLQRMLRETSLPAPMLLVAGIAVMAFLYNEVYNSREPRKIAAQTVMSEAVRHDPLFQIRTSLNDGALSFYAQRVVPPIDVAEMRRLLRTHREIWLVGEELPTMNDVEAQIVLSVDGLKLYRLMAFP